VRPSIEGYADAVLETARAADRAPAVAGELTAVVDLLSGSADLAGVVTDPGITGPRRRAVLTELLMSRVGAETLALVGHVVATAKAPEILDDLAALADRAGGPAPEGELLGRSTAAERLDGYAAAVLDTLDQPAVDRVEEEVFRFGQVVDGSPELAAVLTDREVSPERRAAVVADLLAARAHPATVRLASYAARFGRPRDYAASLEWLVSRLATEAGRRVADVRSAVDLDEGQRQRLGQALGQITGRTVAVRVTVEPGLLGGFVAAVGETLVDGSARHRLDLLKERLHLPPPELELGSPPPAPSDN
jgi:F-type H+-transporting ATPase subunit delta